MAVHKKSRLNELAARLRAIKAKDIMAKDVIMTREDSTLAEVAGIMVKERISGIPVIGKKGSVGGIITMSDLFIVMDMIESGDVLENGAGSFNPTVKFAMSTDIVKIRKNTSVHEIIGLVKYKNIHTLPVFEGEQMVGVIGRRDIFNTFYEAVRSIQ